MSQPNVKERHVRAMYINVPVPVEVLAAMLTPPAVPDVHNGSAWISIVVDDLWSLKLWSRAFGFMPVPGMNGWMIKLNALVKCPLTPHTEPVSGYQIITLDFEKTGFGIAAEMKAKGGIDTQQVPIALAHFTVSSGKTGRTETSPMDIGTEYSALATSAHKPREPLVSVQGKLAALSETESYLCTFVVSRSTKFLAQHKVSNHKIVPTDVNDRSLVYGTWRDPWECGPDGCVGVSVDTISLPILDRLGELLNEPVAELSKRAICFVQPEYSIIDVVNTKVETQ